MEFNVGLRMECPLATDLRMASREHNWCTLGSEPVLGAAGGTRYAIYFQLLGRMVLRVPQFEPLMDWRRHMGHAFDGHTEAILIFLK